MKNLVVSAACLAAVLPLQASLFSFDFPGGFGDGGEESSPNASDGMLMALSITYDDVSNLISVSAMYHDLGSDVIASHVHGVAAPGTAGTPGTNAGINFFLDNDGSTAGFLTGSETLDEAEEANLLAGLWYVNVHTTLFPGGEVRGQLLPELVAVPEPEEYAAMAGLGLLAAGFFVRLRRQSEDKAGAGK